MNQFEQMLAKWGFGTPKSNDGGRGRANPPVPRDPLRDVEQVKEMIETSGGTVTARMILEHPYLRLTADAKRYLEGL